MDALGKILERLNSEVSPQTITVYTRHNKVCPQAEDNCWKRCHCPKWVYIFQGKDFRFSAKTRSWEKAEKLKREIEGALDPVRIELRKVRQEHQARRVLTSDAVESYIADAEKRNVAPQTLKKIKAIFRKKLLPWADQKSLQYIDDWTINNLTQWRASWSALGPLATRNTQERVRTFFRFCQNQGWIEKNPASLLSRIIVKQKPTDYFTPDQFQKLLQATYWFAKGSPNGKSGIWSERLRVLVLLMRWSGLRIGDAVTLERSRLMGDTISLYQAKTGTPVSVLLPPTVAQALRNVPPGRNLNRRYFFWNGASRSSVVKGFGKAFRRLFELADIRTPDGTRKRCHPHMLRDTFAVENLLAGVPIDQVSKLLGHASVKITEKHYSPWVPARQQQLENSVRKSLTAQGMLNAGSYCAPDLKLTSSV